MPFRAEFWILTSEFLPVQALILCKKANPAKAYPNPAKASVVAKKEGSRFRRDMHLPADCAEAKATLASSPTHMLCVPYLCS